MQELAFWKAVIVDDSNFLEAFVALLTESRIRYCVIGGQGVNAYVDPLVSLDLDLVVAVEQLESVTWLLTGQFKIERFPHSLNVAVEGSKLRVQIQTDPRYFPFVERADLFAALKALRSPKFEPRSFRNRTRIRSEEHTSELQSP